MSERNNRSHIGRVPINGGQVPRVVGHLMRNQVPMGAFDDYELKKILRINPVTIVDGPRGSRRAVVPEEVSKRLKKHANHFANLLSATPDAAGNRHSIQPSQVGTHVTRLALPGESRFDRAKFADTPPHADYEELSDFPMFAMNVVLLGSVQVRARRFTQAARRNSQIEEPWSNPRTLPEGAISLFVAQGTVDLDPTEHWFETVGDGERVYLKQYLSAE